jgi:D-amino-acid oxidase
LPDRKRIAVVGAGVAGLTCAVVLRERGYEPVIHAAEPPDRTTSRVAAALWFPYDIQPEDLVERWALASYRRFEQLAPVEAAGVSFVDFQSLSRFDDIPVPPWANETGYRLLGAHELVEPYRSGFLVHVPLADMRKYLDYLESTAAAAVQYGHTLDALDELADDGRYAAIVNCSGYGARALVPDPELVAHRGQVVVVPKIESAPAMACVDPPLIYLLPRADDCVLGGVNEVSDSRIVDPAATALILERCRTYLASLGLTPPLEVREERVGLRPYRESGVCLRARRLLKGMLVVDNYGHGGCGITVSWGCAEEVVGLLEQNG